MYPILFKIGPITIYSYGAMVALAFLISSYLLWYNARLVRLPKELVLDVLVVILVSGLLGARFLHVILNLDFYLKNPIQAILSREGFAFHGGMVFSFIAGIAFLKIKKIPIWPTSDLIAPFAALGQAVGRIGCFLNGCCFGVLGHPTQLYAFGSLLVIYAVLRFMLEKGILKNNLILIYFMLYSFQRFFVDFLRADLPRALFGLTHSQLISIVLFCIAGMVCALRIKK